MTDLCHTCRTTWRDAVTTRARLDETTAALEVERAATRVLTVALYLALNGRGRIDLGENA